MSEVVFPRGPKRGNAMMTTSTITAKRKGDPQHMTRGKTMMPASDLKQKKRYNDSFSF